MEWVETTAKTIEEAKERALDELGIDHDEAEFVVLEEPRAGLFGRTRGEARVRARVTPRTPRAKVERRNRRTRGEQRSSGRGGSTKKSGRAKSAGGGNGERRSAKATSTAPDATAAGDAASDVDDATVDAATNGQGNGSSSGGRTGASKRRSASSRRRRGSASSTSDPSSTPSSDVGSTDSSEAASTSKGNDMTLTLEEQITSAETFLTGLLDAFGLHGSIETTRVDDQTAELNVVGNELGLLIGPRGQTIASIQELTRITLQRQAEGSYEGRVRVDVGGYRAQRREALGRFAVSVAEKVRDSGKPTALEPMSASDRKAVHDAVNEVDGVHTTSEGAEPRRWVMIVPDVAADDQDD